MSNQLESHIGSNIIHVSKTKELAISEIELFFPENELIYSDWVDED